MNAKGLCVTDCVTNPALAAVARFLLAPDLDIAPDGAAAWTIGARGQTLARVTVIAGSGRVEAASCTRRFGIVESTHCLAVVLAAGRAETRWTWLCDAYSLPDRQFPA